MYFNVGGSLNVKFNQTHTSRVDLKGPSKHHANHNLLTKVSIQCVLLVAYYS